MNVLLDLMKFHQWLFMILKTKHYEWMDGKTDGQPHNKT